MYRNILLDSFRYCQEKQGLQLNDWVLMTNHFHQIYSTTDKHGIAMVIKNIKSFTAMKLIDAIINNQKDGRKVWLLEIFEKTDCKIKATIASCFGNMGIIR